MDEKLREIFAASCELSRRIAEIEREAGELRAKSAALALRVNDLVKEIAERKEPAR